MRTPPFTRYGIMRQISLATPLQPMLLPVNAAASGINRILQAVADLAQERIDEKGLGKQLNVLNLTAKRSATFFS
jgi:hypothetical protein